MVLLLFDRCGPAEVAVPGLAVSVDPDGIDDLGQASDLVVVLLFRCRSITLTCWEEVGRSRSLR
jgi:hypothetical protein